MAQQYGPVKGRCKSNYRKNKTTKMCIHKSQPKTPTPKYYGPVKGRCKANYRKNKTTKMCIKLNETIKIKKPTMNYDPSKYNVYIASMNMRGKWADLPANCNSKKPRINVTSSQAKTSKLRLAFSPMTEIPNKYKGFHCFENYWQAGKRYKDVDVEKQKNWWLAQTKGKRRYPLGKGKKVLHAIYPNFSKPLDYITSRKLVYVPEYYDLIKHNSVLKSLQDRAKSGECLVIYDFDGPRLKDKTPSIEKVTPELLIKKLNDPVFPFGHGYIVAAAVAGITPDYYNK